MRPVQRGERDCRRKCTYATVSSIQGTLTAAALSLSPRMPSLTQDCLHVPKTIAVGGTLSTCRDHSPSLDKQLFQSLNLT